MNWGQGLWAHLGYGTLVGGGATVYSPDYLRAGHARVHSSADEKRLLLPRQPEYSNCSHLEYGSRLGPDALAWLLYLPEDLLKPKAVCLPEQSPATMGFSQGAGIDIASSLGNCL